MQNFSRILNLAELTNQRSCFLFGPRATGKSFLIRQQLSSAINLNLLKTELYLRLSKQPFLLEELVLGQLSAKNLSPLIVIDEVQKIPLLLDEVHRLIEEKQWRFLLTGSSARKLKHGHANLLAGRARTLELFPLCWAEIPDFNLEEYLHKGGLPMILTSPDPIDHLYDYVNTYLYEEIKAEGFVRNLVAFSTFLQLAAKTNGQILNYTKIANDVGVSVPTIREYYQILEDTLLGFVVPAWTKSKKRKSSSTGKFYLFDLGVTHCLNDIKRLERKSDLYGRAFEHWIALELRSYISYKRRHIHISFWRTEQHVEVDFLIDSICAIEVKTTEQINDNDLKGLLALAEENQFEKYYLISHDPLTRLTKNILCLPWKVFIEKLWGGEIF